jgi:hypothetical protein
VTAICAFAATAACRELPGLFEGERVVARAGKETLRQMDIEKAAPAGVTGADSLAWVESYVDRWVRDNLKLQEATRLFGENREDEELIAAYRNSLALRRLEQDVISQTTDSLYTEGELRDYYNTHRGEFTLDRTLVRARIMALPTSFRQKARLKELFTAWSGDSRDEAKAMASKNGFTLFDAAEWMEYPEFLEKLPTRRNENYNHLATHTGLQEMTDDDTTYWFVIEEARTEGGVTPYEMVADIVRMAVAARRKAEILKTFEDGIYRTAILENRAAINL